MGSVLIVLGLYGVLWGKKREASCIHNVEGGEKAISVEEFDLESPPSKSEIEIK